MELLYFPFVFNYKGGINRIKGWQKSEPKIMMF